MVERPIKKSERQAKENTDNNSENSDSVTPIESNPKSSKPTRNRSSDKERKASLGDEKRQQGNPALARGPKPVKPPVAKAKTEELETESEPTSEESQD
ncbi:MULTISPECIES: hypothetical protein [unclassified Nostoc]|uniref:hypothetical protein n=1 Tax=unclassified Nostoc TaxID=2593658 RepID=UPI002AD34EB7|nr:hypothetical protein [Nostoc sp. DedQUE03]MDZ7974139.1 hypothetical protein [Nostoc sp. DedQUE03]MDZ8048142.1 hypothetical protein [Nostoc sp. DedQUE02]